MRAQYFFDPTLFSYQAMLQENSEVILKELMSLLEAQSVNASSENQWIEAHPHYVTGKFEQAWKIFSFQFFGIENRLNIARCPETYQIIRQIPELISADFSLMHPHTHITPHKGYSTLILRNHLPLIVPEGNKCGIRVGDETRYWEKGKLMVFDDSYEHEAWNESDEVRVILMFDTAKPGCGYTAREISKYKIDNLNDPFLLSIASKETWAAWHRQGFYDGDPTALVQP